jgi:hypothetical protein
MDVKLNSPDSAEGAPVTIPTPTERHCFVNEASNSILGHFLELFQCCCRGCGIMYGEAKAEHFRDVRSANAPDFPPALTAEEGIEV